MDSGRDLQIRSRREGPRALYLEGDRLQVDCQRRMSRRMKKWACTRSAAELEADGLVQDLVGPESREEIRQEGHSS